MNADRNLAQNKWVTESFGSRAALLAFIYLCVNVVYHEGYLSRLGIEFGFFSISKSLPLFENFLLAAYSFIIWAFLGEISASTYDQFSGFFNLRSWSNERTKRQRFLSIATFLTIYISIYTYFLREEGILSNSSTDTNFVLTLLLRLIWPTWSFITWDITALLSLLLLISIYFINISYRYYRSLGVNQLFHLNKMLFQINVVSPVFFVFIIIFSLIIAPAWYGTKMADLTVYDVRTTGKQEIAIIELSSLNTFCGETVKGIDNMKSWSKNNNSDTTIHLLGNFGNYDLFTKVTRVDKTSGGVDYETCFVSESSVKSIVFVDNN